MCFSQFPNSIFLIQGDFNLSCIDWLEEKVLASNSGVNDVTQCVKFINLLDDLGLSQHSHPVTRPEYGKILDLVITNNPKIVSKVKTVPGISDHNIVLSNFKLVYHRQKPNKRKIFHFNKADWDQVRSAVNTLCHDYFSRNLDDASVDENFHLSKGLYKKFLISMFHQSSPNRSNHILG